MYDSVKNKLSLVSDKDDESMISKYTLSYDVFLLMCAYVFYFVHTNFISFAQ